MTTTNRKPVVLIVRDGWGHNPNPEHNAFNAIHLATIPVNDRLLKEYPSTQVKTSGEDVGLPAGVMGNSEVGHQNIGAGRIVNQELMRITWAIRDGSFFKNETLKGSVAHVQKTGGVIHLLGLVSDGGVHSHVEHVKALIKFYKDQGVDPQRLMIHVITDGRDTAPNSGVGFVQQVEQQIAESGVGRIASIIGRFYAMDRDFRWDRVQVAYDLLTKGAKVAKSPIEALKEYYANPISPSQSGDEFMQATSIETGAAPGNSLIKSGDAVVFFNFRGDRPREISKAFILSDEEWKAVPKGGFNRGKRLQNLYFATMVQYEDQMPVQVIFTKTERMKNTLGEVLTNHDLSQMRCAESEKHPHVTYFFNDYKKACFNGEYQLDIPSPKHVPTYDQLPSMSAGGVTDAVVNALKSNLFDFILVNFANGDMVGHTGSLKAAIEAVETVDAGVGRIVDAALEKGGSVVVTADHGNCEQMIDPVTGGPHTQHTTYDVDLIVVNNDGKKWTLRNGGRLADIAPTVLDLFGIKQPSEMTGQSLICRS